MGEVTIKIKVPDGMEETVRRIVESEVKLIVKRLSKVKFEKTFGILRSKRREIREIEAEIYDEWEI